MQQEDPRLKQSVTINGYRLYIEELLEEISQSAHVSISTAGQPTDVERLSVGFHHLSVAEAMNAIRSVLSYQGATYEWSRAKLPSGEWQYLLTPYNHNFRKELDISIKKSLEDEILQKIAALHKSPEERRKQEDADPALSMSGRNEAAIGSLASLLSPAQIHASIFDCQSFDFSLAENKEQLKPFIDSERETYNKGRNNSPFVVPFPEPEGIQIVVRRDAGRISYDLWLFQKQNNFSYGYSWAGGMPAEKRWRDKIADLWRTREDTEVLSTIKDKELVPVDYKPTLPKDMSESQNPIYVRLREFGDAADLSFIARLEIGTHGTDPGKIGSHQTVSKYLVKLHSVPLDCKSSSGVLAFTNHQLLFDSNETARIPWKVVKYLRSAYQKDVLHRLHWEDYGYVAAQLTAEQLQAMNNPEQEERDKWNDMLYLEPIQPLLASIQERPELWKALQRENGVALTSLPLKARVFINQGGVYVAIQRFGSAKVVSKAPIVSLRLVTTDDLTTKDRYHRLQLLGRDADVLAEYAFPGYPYPQESVRETATRQ